MAVVSTVDGIGVRIYGTKGSGNAQVEKSMSMGALNATRYDEAKALAIIEAAKPCLDISVTKAVKTVDSFLSVSE